MGVIGVIITVGLVVAGASGYLFGAGVAYRVCLRSAKSGCRKYSYRGDHRYCDHKITAGWVATLWLPILVVALVAAPALFAFRAGMRVVETPPKLPKLRRRKSFDAEKVESMELEIYGEKK